MQRHSYGWRTQISFVQWLTVRVVTVTFCLLLPFSASADGMFGSWGWTALPSGLWAGTVNQSGSGFGQGCYYNDQTCYWLLGLRQSCEPGSKYPVLVNTDAGANSLEVVCVGTSEDKSLYRYAFSNFQAIDGIVGNATRIGFAFPLRGDQFIVVRFDMDGSRASVNAMRKLVDEHAKSQPSGTRSTKDEVL